mmetsp:Transcript_15434/g.31681  ORF Transcript_15434/g.31681 Transcript_15434/m.31681 type:complete len:141 (-) Transcript_15434:284-706(-)
MSDKPKGILWKEKNCVLHFHNDRRPTKRYNANFGLHSVADFERFSEPTDEDNFVCRKDVPEFDHVACWGLFVARHLNAMKCMMSMTSDNAPACIADYFCIRPSSTILRTERRHRCKEPSLNSQPYSGMNPSLPSLAGILF